MVFFLSITSSYVTYTMESRANQIKKLIKTSFCIGISLINIYLFELSDKEFTSMSVWHKNVLLILKQYN